jgi:hypothetical protein
VGEGEAKVLVEFGVFGFILAPILEEIGVKKGGGDGAGAVNSPLGGGHALDEKEFEKVDRFEGVNKIAFQLFK